MIFRPDISPTPVEPNWENFCSRLPVFEKKTYLISSADGASATDFTDALQRYIRDRQKKGTDWLLGME